MKHALAILCLAICGAVPIEAPRPVYGVHLKSPPRWHHRRFEASDYIVFTPRGWVRSSVYDRARRVQVYEYVFGRVTYQLAPFCDEVEPGDEL